MDCREYQESVWGSYGGREMSLKEITINNVLGLVGESGEVADLAKKEFYLGRDIQRADYVEELGDVLWHLTCLGMAHSISLEEIMESNLEKLKVRYPNGTP